MSINAKSWVVVTVALLAAGPLLAGTTAFVNVNVVPMSSESVIAAQTVIVDNGVIKKLAVEEPMKFEVSSAEAILHNL